MVPGQIWLAGENIHHDFGGIRLDFLMFVLEFHFPRQSLLIHFWLYDKLKKQAKRKGEIKVSYDTLVRDMFETLPSEEQAEVVDFVMFLKKRQKAVQTDKGEKSGTFPFDCFAGGLKYISEDFDEPLADFGEYM